MRLLRMNLSDQDRVRCLAQPDRAEVKLGHTGEHEAQRGVQRDGQNRGDDHGQALGVRERPEEPPFLAL